MIKKQKSWFKTDKDIRFENSFKFWFALMWQNHYIQIFTVAFFITILGLIRLDWIIDVIAENLESEGHFGASFAILGFSIPPLICSIISYKGFYQYFKDLKNNTTR